MVGAGAAFAARPVGNHPTIRFWNSFGVVTMEVPAQRSCPIKQPDCEWMLYVNEPDIPAQTVVGTATAKAGSTTVVQVDYPSDFCGVIQADALVGPNPWEVEFGHKQTIDTCDTTTTTTSSTTTTCPPSTTTTTKPWHSPTTTSTTKPKYSPTTTTHPAHTAAATSALPFSSSTTPNAAATAGTVDATTATTAPSSLPFTGADLRPLIVIGGALIFAGLAILTSLEQRRRALRRLGAAMTIGAQYSSRTSHWFLGD